MQKSSLFVLFLLSAACDSGTDDDDDTSMAPAQCRGAEYIAFDPANHSPQDLRLGAFTQMVDLMNDARNDVSLASANFAQARMLYQDTANLRDKVMGRKDDHFPDNAPVGPAIDMAIMDGLMMGETATVALDANMAKQKVEKTLIHFFYLSVFHEMLLGQRSKWDEAYGYWGAKSTNDEATRVALAAVATKRDGTNNTNLADSVFNDLVDGSCELAKALEEMGGDELDPSTVPALQTIIDSADLDMQKVLAYSVGHEAFDMTEFQADLTLQENRDGMWVKLAELDPYFKPIEALMRAKGGESLARAERIRTAVDEAWADPTGAWMETIDAQGIIDDLEAEYQIDVKG